MDPAVPLSWFVFKRHTRIFANTERLDLKFDRSKSESIAYCEVRSLQCLGILRSELLLKARTKFKTQLLQSRG